MINSFTGRWDRVCRAACEVDRATDPPPPPDPALTAPPSAPLASRQGSLLERATELPALLAATQQGQSLRPGRLAAELVGPMGATTLIADAQRLADALTRAGHRLAPPLRPRAAMPTVH